MSSTEVSRRSAPRWIILVDRGQDDLYQHLREIFQRDGQVEVIMDRRKDPRRSSTKIVERLRARGVAVIRRET
jgi:hypothetical protein